MSSNRGVFLSDNSLPFKRRSCLLSLSVLCLHISGTFQHQRKHFGGGISQFYFTLEMQAIRSLFIPTWSSDTRLDGKTAIVTGGNNGIGKETVKDLASRGARVILACRDMAKGEQAACDIVREVKGAKVVTRQLDLADTKSICQFAENIYNSGWHTQHTHGLQSSACICFPSKYCDGGDNYPVFTAEKALHYLINNAGVAVCPYARTVDGYEMQFGVNHLGRRKNTQGLVNDKHVRLKQSLAKEQMSCQSAPVVTAKYVISGGLKLLAVFSPTAHLGHFFLTFLLLDLLKHSAPSRVINLSSAAHFFGKIHFDDLKGEKDYHHFRAYAQSKLANVLFTRELAKRTEVLGVTAYSVDPGLVNTDILRYIRRPLLDIVKNFGFLIKTPAEGAYTTIYCTVTPENQLVTGGYYSNCSRAESSNAGQDDGTALKLWAVSCHLLGIRWR
uniref:Uncharacterized protein n=1 Tax=Oreochromis niloticus TaxID=8128 RepID=I3KAR8_ORENI